MGFENWARIWTRSGKAVKPNLLVKNIIVNGGNTPDPEDVIMCRSSLIDPLDFVGVLRR